MLVEDVMIMALLRAGAGAAPPRGDAVVGRISPPLWDAVKCLAVLRLWTEALLSMHGANLPLLCFADENDVHRKKKNKKGDERSPRSRTHDSDHDTHARGDCLGVFWRER